MPLNNFNDIFNSLSKNQKPKIAVAVAEDEAVIKTIYYCQQKGIADSILVGNKAKINSISLELGIDINNFHIIDEIDIIKAASIATDLIVAKEASVIMKGLLDTSIFLKAILKKEKGLRGNNLLSHVSVFEFNNKLLLVTDCAMNIAPNLEEKKQIIENAVKVAKSLNIFNPKVAVIAAIEKVNSNMLATVEARELSLMSIKDYLVDGPFALDNAISKEAAAHKGVVGSVAGDANILLMPNIESGNILYKSLVHIAKLNSGGIIVGANIPIVLTSRSDDAKTKLNSIALSLLVANKEEVKYE